MLQTYGPFAPRNLMLRLNANGPSVRGLLPLLRCHNFFGVTDSWRWDSGGWSSEGHYSTHPAHLPRLRKSGDYGRHVLPDPQVIQSSHRVLIDHTGDGIS